jgi:hypothetical protein
MEKQIGRFENAMSALSPIADMVQHDCDVCFVPIADIAGVS